MNKEVYLSNLEWTKTHDNIGGVKSNLVFKENMTYEEYEKLHKRTYYVLNDTNLQSNWNSLKEWFKYGIEEYSTDDGFIQHILKQGLDKMNELEGEDNDT